MSGCRRWLGAPTSLGLCEEALVCSRGLVGTPQLVVIRTSKECVGRFGGDVVSPVPIRIVSLNTGVVLAHVLADVCSRRGP